ncbi:hypothetical protein BH23GEM7_BH23GEM7_01630 [soil metagenome]
MAPRRSTLPANWFDYRNTARVLGWFTFVAVVLVALQDEVPRWTTVLVALASFACGAALGFLFGIPRVLQHDTISPRGGLRADQADDPASYAGTGYRLQVNTNLEQISDWLTKIIVGLGLIHLGELPGRIQDMLTWITPSPGATNAPAVAISVILSFTIIGFFVGYLMTRLYLTGAFARADMPIPIAGREMTVEQVSAQVRNLVADLQDQVLELRHAENLAAAGDVRTLSERANEGLGLKVKSILWVDDRPENNSLMIERLTNLGISVVTATSTAAALARLEQQPVDRIISDLARPDDPGNEIAGIEFIRELRSRGVTTPVIIHCAPEAAVKYRQQALEAGAEAVTPSQTGLLDALRLDQ